MCYKLAVDALHACISLQLLCGVKFQMFCFYMTPSDRTPRAGGDIIFIFNYDRTIQLWCLRRRLISAPVMLFFCAWATSSQQRGLTTFDRRHTDHKWNTTEAWSKNGNVLSSARRVNSSYIYSTKYMFSGKDAPPTPHPSPPSFHLAMLPSQAHSATQMCRMRARQNQLLFKNTRISTRQWR